MTQRRKIRIGDLLVEQRVISQVQLEQALAEQRVSGRKLGSILIESGFISEDLLLEVLSRQLGVPYIDLQHYQFEPDVVRLLPEIHARRFRAIALKVEKDAVLVGMSDPTNIFAFDELARILKRPVHIAVVRESHLLATIDRVYRRTEEISGFAEELKNELDAGDIDLADLVQVADVAEAPVVKLLQSLFEDAAQIGASDVHIEPDEFVLRIRQRVDGELHEQIMNEKRIASALVLRLKLMSQLDISEKRLPQDGRFTMKLKSKTLDVRLSTMPTQYGESVVLRLLDQTAGVLDLDHLGMPDPLRRRYERLVQRPYGMVLVTGPTGSGKTTTLYSTLKLLNTARQKIISVEDPVEYRMPRVNQVQVHADIGLDFARVLRSALRQDPDILLVGEMRDEETVEVALRAALTGHMVLSTLHTNDAVGTVGRLLDMGAPGYLLASALVAVQAQRLVRRLCPSCAAPCALTPQELAWLRAFAPEVQSAQFRSAPGCSHCNNSGYRGRVGVYELLELDGAMATALARGDSAAFAAAAQGAPGFRSLDRVALDHALEGVTSLAEVLRVSASVEREFDRKPGLVAA